jgi:hypothetical protein
LAGGNTDDKISFTNSYTTFISNAGSGSAGNECAYAIKNNNATATAGGCNVPVTGIAQVNNAAATGVPKFKTGSRTLTFAVKYYF